jgi:hypothetical protein
MAITVRTMKYSAQWSNAVLQCSVCFDMALLNGNVSCVFSALDKHSLHTIFNVPCCCVHCCCQRNIVVETVNNRVPCGNIDAFMVGRAVMYSVMYCMRSISLHIGLTGIM